MYIDFFFIAVLTCYTDKASGCIQTATITSDYCCRRRRGYHSDIRSRSVYFLSQALVSSLTWQHTGGGLMTPGIKTPTDLFSFSHDRNPIRMDDARLGALRTVSARPEGVVANVDEQIRSWRTEREMREEAPDHNVKRPRIGIGLAMSHIYSTSVYNP